MPMFQRVSHASNSSAIAPRLVIGYEAWRRMHEYALACTVEINGFAYVSQSGPDTFEIYTAEDVFITPQKVTMHSADVDSVDFARATAAADDAGRLDQFRVQWHSHVSGESYFSYTDMANIANFGASGMTWWISLVLNKAGDVSARLDQFRPIRLGAPMDIYIAQETDPDGFAKVRQEIEDFVTIIRPKEKHDDLSCS